MPDAPDHSPAAHQDEILLLAEKLGEALDRLNKIESEFTAQTAPLDAAGASIGAANTALQAALKGIEQLSFHVLDNNLGAVSKRLESHEKLTAAEHRALAEKTDQIRIALGEATKYIATRFEKLETQRNEFTQAQASEVDRVRAEFSAGQKNITEIVDTLTAQLADTRREFAEPKSLNPAGKWDAQHPGGYDRLDVVSLNGTSYISQIDGNTEKPSKTSSAWTVLSSRGGSVLAGGGATDITGVAGMGETGLQIAQSPTPDEARDILGVNDFTGATALADGAAGRVIQPVAGDQNKYLRADGTWSTVSSVTAPAASQSTVNAGLVDNEYVSPKTNEVRTLAGDATRAPRGGLAFTPQTCAINAPMTDAQVIGTNPFSLSFVWDVPPLALLNAATNTTVGLGSSSSSMFIGERFNFAVNGTTGVATIQLYSDSGSSGRSGTLNGFAQAYAGTTVFIHIVRGASSDPLFYINKQLQTVSWSGALSPQFSIGNTYVNIGTGSSNNLPTGKFSYVAVLNAELTQADVNEITRLSGMLPEPLKSGSMAVLNGTAWTNSASAFSSFSSADGSAVAGTQQSGTNYATTPLSVVAGQRYRVNLSNATAYNDIAVNANSPHLRVATTLGGSTYLPVSNLVNCTPASTGTLSGFVAYLTGTGATSFCFTAVVTGTVYLTLLGAAGAGVYISGSTLSLSSIAARKVGALCFFPLDDGVGYQLRDVSGNGLHAIMNNPAGITHVKPLPGPAFVRTTSYTSGNQQLTAAPCIPANSRLIRIAVRALSGTPAVTLGTSSGGTQVGTSLTLSTAWKNMPILLTDGLTGASDISLWAASTTNATVQWQIEWQTINP